ncbi:uncharacterized protein ARMOST_21503 [Armillaria ostoyae]|uniref:Uncharacterized protein n=1 Tax=Armillaria ostoyae TaxID=47428 RepID=A0A284SA90_ARMOS|nr:uncharacterized protein ARMOST_21503 [Armillaria ostoyae]
MSEQRPHILYITQLIRKGHGYPFWYPEPDSSRSTEYTQEGVHPGDVGILNDIGGFDFLFNIFREAQDPINGGNVPPGFKPLQLSSAEPLRSRQACYNKIITSADVSYREISASVSADASGIVGAGASFEFSTTKETAAILCLPQSATKYDFLNKSLIKEYSYMHGASWYHYVNSSQYLGREAANGSLYVVTGCDKTTSWGIAAVTKPANTRSLSLRFTGTGVGGGEIRLGQGWSSGFTADTRVYPLQSIAYPYSPNLENQCVFSRGFTISLSHRLFKSDGKTVLNSISGSPKDKIPSFENKAPCPPMPKDISTFRHRSYPQNRAGRISRLPPPMVEDEDEMDSDSSWELEDETSISEFPAGNNEVLNFSAAINEYFLKNDPVIDIVVTHDEDWMDIIRLYQDNGGMNHNGIWYRIKEALDEKYSPCTEEFLPPTPNALRMGKVPDEV